MAKTIPLHNNVLIEPLSDESASWRSGTKTKSGILIPETVDKEKPDQGKVIEVGAGRRDNNGKIIPMSVKKGQKVVFSSASWRNGPDEIKIDGKKYYIINEDNILAIIE